MTESADADRKHLFVVPTATAPLVPLSSSISNRGEVDQALDEVFGDVDDEGPGTTDAVLVVGGTAAVIASQVAALPVAVMAGGIVAVALGAVIPLRSALRRFKSSREDQRLHGLIGDGYLLDSRSAVTRQLIATHDSTWRRSVVLTEVQQLRLRNASHALIVEAASLLDGRPPTTEAEVQYCQERLAALRSLEALIDDVAEANKQAGRVEQVAGRREVEATASHSALDQARELTSDLLDGRHD